MEDIALELIETLFQIARLVKNKISFTNNSTCLSALQLYALRYIDKHQEASMGDIADYFTIELPSATSLINKLVKDKLIVRCEGKNDRRKVRLILTPKGRKTLQRIQNRSKYNLRRVLTDLSEKEQLDLLSILQSLQEKLKNQ